MNAAHPPPIPSGRPKKSGMPTWIIVLIVLGVAGFIGIAAIGMLAAIAIPNFVKARQTAQMNACINRLRIIDSAKQQWALEKEKLGTDTPTQSDVETYLRGDPFPICPGGGSYAINAVDQKPSCSVESHRLPDHSLR